MVQVECQACWNLLSPSANSSSNDGISNPFLFFPCGHGMCKNCIEKDSARTTCHSCRRPKGTPIQLFVDFLSDQEPNAPKKLEAVLESIQRIDRNTPDVSVRKAVRDIRSFMQTQEGTESKMLENLLDSVKHPEQRLAPALYDRNQLFIKCANLQAQTSKMEETMAQRKKEFDEIVSGWRRKCADHWQLKMDYEELARSKIDEYTKEAALSRSKLAEKNGRIIHLQREVEKQKKMVVERNGSVDHLHHELDKQTKRLVEKDDSIIRLRRQIEMQKKMLTDRDGSIFDLLKTVAKQNEMAERAQQIRQKAQGQSEALTKSLKKAAARCQQLDINCRKLESILKEHEEQIHVLRYKNGTLVRQADQMKEILAQKDNDIVHLWQEINKQHVLADKEQRSGEQREREHDEAMTKWVRTYKEQFHQSRFEDLDEHEEQIRVLQYKNAELIKKLAQQDGIILQLYPKVEEQKGRLKTSLEKRGMAVLRWIRRG